MNQYSDLIKKQRAYYYKGETRKLAFRLKMLKRLKHVIRTHEVEIASALKKDLGKSRHEAITTEIGFTLTEINTMIRGLEKWDRHRSQKTNFINFPARSLTIREPYGLVLIIGPWNYPFQLLMSPLVGAIAGGNCTIVKPSELTPNTAQLIDDLISKNFNKAYIAVEQGGIPETEALLEQNYDKIFFTGSTNVGKIVMKSASKHLTPLVLELGGKSPTIVDRTANIELAAKRIVFGKGINAGQTCVAPDYVLVHESVKDAFYEAFGKAIKSQYGDDLLANPDFGRIINQRNYERVKGYLGDGKLIHGGFTDDENLHIDLTMVQVEGLDAPIMRDEIFGPILPVIVYSKYSEIVEIIRSNPDPLALYLFSRNKKFIGRVLQDIHFGGGCINDTIMHLTNEHLPFGGRGTSGMGNYHGKYSYEAFTHKKAVLKGSSTIDMPLRYAPYKGHALEIIKKIMYR